MIDPRTPSSVPRPGDRIAGRYVLEAQLGRGGMGVVFRARDLQLQRDVAIKFVLGGGGAKRLARFARECELVSQAGARGVVQVHECGERDGLPYLVMELLRGESLEDLLARGPLEPVRAARLMEAVARTLGSVHARGILHRDLKPGNVLIGDDGHPRLTDFGLAWSADSDRLTGTGELMGTPFYMAPELLSGRPADARSDLFALGVVVYQTVTGRLPFEGESLPLLFAAIAADDPPPPSTLRPLARGWDLLCARALAADPAARYARAEELADDLARLARGEELVAPAWRPRLRRRTLVGLAAVALLALVGAAGAVARTRATARAHALLDEVRAWDDQALVPFDLGLGGAALDPAELKRRLVALEAFDAWWLAKDPRDRLAQTLERLRAHRRLVDHGVALHGDCDPRPGSPTTLAVNALLLQAHGRSVEALAAAAAAVDADPESPLARRARAAVWRGYGEGTPLARAGELVAHLQRPRDPDERVCAEAALEAAACRWYLGAIDAGDRASLEPLAALAAQPGAQAIVARAKHAALEARAGAWAATDEVAATRASLVRLGELLRAPPPVRPGPLLSAQLERDVGVAIDAWRASPGAETTRRAVELEAGVWYELGHAHPGGLPPELVVAAAELINNEQLTGQAAPPSLAFLLLGLRTGGLVEGPGAVPRRTEMLVRRFASARDELARLAEQRPTQSALFALALLDREGRRATAAQKLAALERVLADGAAPDLHPERLGEVYDQLADDLNDTPRAHERGLECAAAALALARDPDRFESAVKLLGDARLRQVMRGPDRNRARANEARLAAHEEGVAELERRLATAPAGPLRSRGAAVLARLLGGVIDQRLERGEPGEQLVPLARRAFAIWDAHRTYVFARESEEDVAGRVAALLERSGDPEDAAHARLLRERDRR